MRARTAVSFEDARDRTKPEKAAVARSAHYSSASIFGVALQNSGVLLALIAVALWALTHSYQGIFGDTNVYVGRALADLDPTGIGRDVMFVNDGQSRFSLFPLLLDRLIGTLGTPETVLLLALLAMTAWMSALALFARQFVAWRLVPVVIIFVAVLPTFYGSIWHFGYSEIQSVPRPFAEALVLGALAALAARQSVLSAGLLLLATLLHPLMALAGWGVFAIVFCSEDRRWLLVALLAFAAVFIAAALGAPLFDRLFRVMAPDLKALAQTRSAMLFPTRWSLASYAPIVLQAATLIVAASFFAGRHRKILLAVILVGVGGIAAQALFGDYFSIVLVIQAQLWRMGWLLAAMGAAALALCALKLPQKGPAGYLVLALLAAAWLAYDNLAGVVALSALALLVHFNAARLAPIATWRVVVAAWVGVAVYGLLLNGLYIERFWAFLSSIPAQGPGGTGLFWNNRRYIALPIAAAAVALSLRGSSRLAAAVEAAAALGLAIAVWHFWDDRSAFQKLIDSNRHPPELMQLLAGRDGEILWLGGQTEAWFLTGRPQWASPQQGVSTIFSPTLARTWRDRTQFLIDDKLVEKEALAIVHNLSSAELMPVTAQAIVRLCARPDAPAWVVAPVYQGSAIPTDLRPEYWVPPVPNFHMTEEPDKYIWHRISSYAVVPCAGTRV
ncbi:hypothetical protein CWB41_03570 [Methylovirgula ligni]|uniref:Uncharacterized protein n=1 Tax=Methylovirgula ligni TaxID=569860 RepID=A0A3D9YRE3_9HYPH|nr:hypothetical protein [Methylovirgula ligni]QAY94927.1 hypothetical protein CWB41_03570 [Methylovirgula ligni]REF84628.1 hypothetical protein DES32_2738 [Methylovirgula ligni]